ncbi:MULTISPECIES: hypothetical protein [Desulfococcus]|uniref:Uncharacterized protein n=1 Tax=Desulfococcus multivorans DSM 2059 TaxID=1121405 RepID=S7U0Y2_DESML|nr:hypothetical protein [Desulfococcus multivorans]AOY59314.1 conserved uncharacterized protein [Desulfococcus multivorans]AQV01533.1 hypothetical protein B2D07_12725 [Desulfococcus multivorans]EPR42992.1 hypothetical protein dsmv_1422 [Desulfococcus multivorans DSM 2059]SKA14560.1 hypothetical protein SAMN02745446_02965 [Desulfococcus multivorans DSM 2059]
MKDSGSLHLKVQELCDCYATTDPLKEMSELPRDADKDEAALKWLSLAALHGVNSNAKEIELVVKDDGTVKVTAEYRTGELPSPGPNVAGKIIEALKGITHFEEGKGKTPLALGIRDSSIELQIKMKPKDGGNKISIKFPE